MRYLKPLKILTYVISVIICTYYSYVVQAWAEKRIHDYKRQLVASTIEEDLSAREIHVDKELKKAKPFATLTSEDLKRAIWVLDAKNAKLENALATVRSALDYHQGEG